jgi:hypothetical protein
VLLNAYHVGRYLRANIKILVGHEFQGIEEVQRWGEEGGKLFVFPRNIFLNSSLAPDVERKL